MFDRRADAMSEDDVEKRSQFCLQTAKVACIAWFNKATLMLLYYMQDIEIDLVA